MPGGAVGWMLQLPGLLPESNQSSQLYLVPCLGPDRPSIAIILLTAEVSAVTSHSTLEIPELMMIDWIEERNGVTITAVPQLVS